MSDENRTTIRTGSRVVLSPLGKMQLVRTSSEREGTVLRMMYDGRVVVAWDNTVKPTDYHPRFLSVVSPAQIVS